MNAVGPIKFCPKCKENKSLDDFGKMSKSPDGKQIYCFLCRKSYREKNKIQENDRAKKWREKNKIKNSSITQEEKNKQNYKCLVCGLEKNGKNFSIDRSSLNCVAKICLECSSTKLSKFYEKNKEKIKSKVKIYSKTNKETISKKRSLYRLVNKEKINKYFLDRNRNDYAFRLRTLVSTCIRKGLKNENGNFGFWKKLHYTPTELKNHLENLFIEGMSWENYGVYRVGEPMTWHIDHIIPQSYFDLTNEEDVIKCWSLSNLRPLWAIENLQKSNKIIVISQEVENK